MAVNPNPPITIDPSVNDNQKWAFVNQNFQSLADTLQKNSSLIVGSGTVTLNALINQGSFTSPVYHNLSYVPYVVASAHSPGFSSNQWAQLPYLSLQAGLTWLVLAQISVISTTYLQFEVDLGANPVTHVGNWTINYLLLNQQIST